LKYSLDQNGSVDPLKQTIHGLCMSIAAQCPDPEGELLEEEKSEYSCGLWDIDQRSTAVSGFN
jgi:hypothetical protein